MSVNVLYQPSTSDTAGRDGHSGRRFRNLSPANERQFARASRRLPKFPKLLYLCRGIESQNRACRPSTLLSSKYETLFWLVEILLVKW
jgi:hypothetical protein